MNILHIIPSLDPKSGGPMECLVQIAGEHARANIGVEVVCFDKPDADYLENFGITAHGLGKGFTYYQYNPKLVPWLRDNLNRFNAVVIHGLWKYHSYGAWRALRQAKIPYFVYTHGMLDPWFRHTYPLKHFKKWLFWPWGDYRVLRDANAVLFTCEEERLLASQSFELYKATEKVVKFGAATPPQDAKHLRECFLSSFPSLRDKRLLLFLSRIHEKKGCDILIEAFSRVANHDPSLQLVMAGPDQTGWAPELKDLAKRLGVAERITWTGMLRGDQKWGAFYSSDLFTLPSHQENFGIVVAESLGCGVPVLISNKVNIWREIEADGAGLVGNDNVIDTERNLRRWLEISADEQGKMAERARACFEDRFTVGQMASSLLNAIEEFA